MIKYGQAMWHQLGTDVTKEKTLAAVLKKAKIDWLARKYDIRFGGVAVGWEDYPGRYMLARADTHQAFNIVKKNYTLIQNHEAFSIFLPWVTSGQARFHAAGCYGNGNVWLMLELTDSPCLIAKDDAISKYVLITHSFDDKPLAVHIMPVRKQSQVVLHVGPSGMTMRHTAAWSKNENIFDLGIVQTLYSRLLYSFRAMAATPMSHARATAFIHSVITDLDRTTGNASSSRIQNMRETACGQLDAAWNNTKGVKDTAWAAYNSIAEYVSWTQCCPKEDAQPWRRLPFAWFGIGARLRFEALMSIQRVCETT